MAKKKEEIETEYAPAAQSPVYIALTGLNYGPEDTRIEAGDEVPASVVDAAPWLLTDGHVVVQGN